MAASQSFAVVSPLAVATFCPFKAKLTVKVQTKLLGKAEGIIQKLLGPEGLGSTKTLAAEESKFSMVFNGGKRRPFDIGSILAKKCVPNTAVVSTTTSSGDTKPSVKGSAGYYFWETRKGYAFYSIDGLLDPENEDRPAMIASTISLLYPIN